MSARQTLADALTEALGASWRVIPYDDNPTVLDPTVMFYRERVDAGSTRGLVTHTFALHVVGPGQAGTSAADDLDALLDAVLDVLDTDQTLARLTWSTAEYEVLGDTNPAFKITATLAQRKEYL
jgi:hypothetical protein